MPVSSQPSPSDSPANGGHYVVVARRYRPQTFDELIGQEHVAKGLKAAISGNRVGHAYLFTGARGVGKTSAARILAKALNCEQGPTATPCNECEICESIAAGNDVDVLEIDGASNRGIDEIRQLRQNVAVRPSRARFKIYIIDEVHMLTKEAFNALLKTLEEPPEHVKFIFATTEANKIPITILSRCQRYDFAGIDAGDIERRLGEIAASEGVEVDADALSIIGIRAAGSMRDSQSLFEQLLSSGKRRITAADVTELLGLAPAVRLSGLVEPLVNRNAAAALAELDAAIAEGADVGQLIDQLLGYFRDAMTQAVGCGPERMLYVLPGQRDEVREVAERLGVQTLLAASQILDQAASRLRISTQVRTLAEMAIVRICNLENLDEISAILAQLKGDGAADAPGDSAKKNARPAVNAPHIPLGASVGTMRARVESAVDAPLDRAASNAGGTASGGVEQPRGVVRGVAASGGGAGAKAAAGGEPAAVTGESAAVIWKQALEGLTGLLADSAATATRFSADASGRLVASFPASQKFHRDACERPANLSRIQDALAEAAGRRVGLVLATHEDDAVEAEVARLSPKQLQAEAAEHPFVSRAIELFGADPTKIKVVVPSEGPGRGSGDGKS